MPVTGAIAWEKVGCGYHVLCPRVRLRVCSRGAVRKRDVRLEVRADYSPPAWRNRATAEQKRKGWEMAVRIEKILCTVLDEAHKQQVEKTTETLSEGPEEFYRSRLD